MYCRHCGSEIHDEAVVCIHCGRPVKEQAPVKEQNYLALIGFILSFFSSIAGVICCAIAYRRCKENPELDGKGFAQAGLIIGAVKLAVAIFAIVFWFLFFILATVGIISSFPFEEVIDTLAVFGA